ncbi:hypothetical protein ACSTD8_21790, partial [Vibrio vulnificus]|uniref:hypothetical protein n=1 Tax=Vibrio vulnificus TaxID=672 RepID=UPI003EDA1668
LKTINLRLFTNPFRPSQLAENTKRILNEIVAWTLKTDQTHNAALRGECRLNQVSADLFTTKTHRILKMPRGMNPS